MPDQPPARSRYAKVAAELRDEIVSGRWPPGVALPSEGRLSAQRRVSRDVLRAALAQLRTEGLVTTVHGGSTYVRDRRPVRLLVSRFSHTFSPGTPAPWQAAAAESGLVGSVEVVSVVRHTADEDVVRHLGIAEDDEVIVRQRRMLVGEPEAELIQRSDSIIPYALVKGTKLSRRDRIPSGIYQALAEIGHVPTTMTEEVTARMPTPDESSALGLVHGIPVIDVQRLTRDQDGLPIELLKVLSIADRTVLVYDDLPIARAD